MLTALTGARILTPDEEIPRGTVVIEDGRLVEVSATAHPPPRARITELPGFTLAPGFIDIHVHGGGGFSLSTAEPEEVRSYARWVAARGVTSFLCSVVAATAEGAVPALRAVAEASGPVSGGATVLGAHLEGPFVNPVRRGALPQGWPHQPDVALFHRLLEAAAGHLRVMTIAPELPGSSVVQDEALKAGCVVAVGHSDATYEEAKGAFAAGAALLTHAFNGMRPFHHREPGPLGAALDADGATVELIGDGVHVHPAAARMVLVAKGAGGVALVTDGVPAAGESEGAFRLGGQEARLSRGKVTLADGTIAGSAATMDEVVRAVAGWGLLPLAEVVRAASTVPARVLGLADRKGRLAPGYDADLVALDDDLKVVATWVAGKAVYTAG